MSESAAAGDFGRAFAKNYSARHRRALGLDTTPGRWQDTMPNLTKPIIAPRPLIDTSMFNFVDPVKVQLGPVAAAFDWMQPQVLGQGWLANLNPSIAGIFDSVHNTILDSFKPAITNIAPASIFPNVTVGADMARMVANSMDFSGWAKAFPADMQGSAVKAMMNVKPLIDFLSDEDLDELVDETWSTHPDLAEKLESDPDYVKLTDHQKLAMKVGVALALLFTCLVVSTVISQDKELSEAWEVIERTITMVGWGSGSVVLYRFLEKHGLMFKKVEEEEGSA